MKYIIVLLLLLASVTPATAQENPRYVLPKFEFNTSKMPKLIPLFSISTKPFIYEPMTTFDFNTPDRYHLQTGIRYNITEALRVEFSTEYMVEATQHNSFHISNREPILILQFKYNY
jgi:hypothetical protein